MSDHDKDAAKSNFLATMSHEMRTPVQAVYGLLELIELEDINPRVREMTGIAKSSANALLEILDDVLDFAKMDADKLDLDDFEVPVRTLVRGTMEALSVKVQGRPVRLKDEIDEDVPVVIKGDPKRLRQILTNLCGNAIKFTAQGSVTVRVSRNCPHLSLKDDDIGLRFEVIDTGAGMDQETSAKLFQPFQQADSSTSRKYGGTGLGLSICKKLVEMMGGQIGVLSEKDKGSNFWFELPTSAVEGDRGASDLPDLTGLSILSVEDHPQGAREIVSSLRSMGALVESVPTAKEGRKLIEARPYDVAIIDQGLPDGEGLQLIRDMMDIRANTGFIMYTVHDDSGLQHSLQALGVAYLSKPASRKGLGEAVKDAAVKTHVLSSDSPRRLLIAEDTESVRDLIKRQLASLNVEADFVRNGAEALNALKKGEYGILFTDLHMPELDGYALVQTVRALEKADGDKDKRMPVIALTADIQMKHKNAYLAHGFDECLIKPVTLGHFRRLLVRWGLLEEGEAAQPEEKTQQVITTYEAGSAINEEAVIAQIGPMGRETVDMLVMFIRMTEPLFSDLKRAVKDGKAGDVSETAHSLKGAARSAGALKLGDMAESLQSESENDNAPSFEALVADMEAEFARVREEVKAMRSSLQA